MWGGDFALALIGEGRMWRNGQVVAASKALSDAGLTPVAPAPREGLALVSHSSISAAIATLAVEEMQRLYTASAKAVALTLEGFRANLSAFDRDLLALRPQSGQMQAAEDILACLEGSTLKETGAARRLQDPLSIRNIPQVHGAFKQDDRDAQADEFGHVVVTAIYADEPQPGAQQQAHRNKHHDGRNFEAGCHPLGRKPSREHKNKHFCGMHGVQASE